MPDTPPPPRDPDRARAAGFEHGGHLMAVVEGPDLTLVAVNAAARSVVGDRTLGVPLREAFNDVAGQQVFELYERCYRTGEVQQVQAWRLEVDGPAGRPAELYLDITTTPWSAPDGSVLGVTATAADVSERVRARLRSDAAREATERDLVEARTIALTMQEAHLPQALPVLPRLDVAARYLLAVDGSAAGGDWFDVVVRPGGRVAMVVGDVVGHGIVASATMGRLSAVVHERLSSEAPLEQVLADVDRFARHEPDARHATLCIVELDLDTGAGWYCTAGHPPPLVVEAAGARFLPPTGGTPLATSGLLTVSPIEPAEREAVLVLYTDGLVERPGVTPVASTVELAEIAQNAVRGRGRVRQGSPRTAERVGRRVLELMTRTTGVADDITLLVAQRRDPPPALELRLTADVEGLAVAREGLLDWLDDLEVRDLDRVALSHAAFELLANVVEHAYPAADPPGELGLDLSLDDSGRATLVVADRGRWRGDHDPTTTEHGDEGPAPTGGRGRGLQLASAFLDTFDVRRADDGTVAVGTLPVTREAHLMTGSIVEIAGAGRVDRGDGLGLVEEADRLRLSGPLLPESVPELDLLVRGRTAGGTSPLVLDLTDVTHLGSAAVRVLHDLVTTEGLGVTLVAPPGSTARHVLDLVGLPVRSPGTAWA